LTDKGATAAASVADATRAGDFFILSIHHANIVHPIVFWPEVSAWARMQLRFSSASTTGLGARDSAEMMRLLEGTPA
jgi:hypothetical protein